MRRRKVLGMGLATIVGGARAQGGAGLLYVGSYAPAGVGIYRFALDPARGSLRPLGQTPNPHSPSWLAADGPRRRLYAAEEGGDHLSVYQADAQGELQLLQRQASGGQGPVHLLLAHGRAWVAHYGDGRLSSLPLQPDGRLGAAESWMGAGPTPSHAHMIQASPDGRWLLSTDLGRDRLDVWPLPEGGTPPGAAQELALRPGGGPRHLVFHPQRADRLYVLLEKANTLCTVALTPQGPQLLHECPLLPSSYAGTSYASDLLLAPGGQHLYALNRLHNSLAVLSLQSPEAPRLLDHHWVHGDYPRSACQVGPHLYVCNQRSDQLSHFELSRPEQPRYTGQQTAVPSPAVACFL